MSPNKAVKIVLKDKKINSSPAVKHRKPIGYNEPLLPSYTE
ncbi:10754_t:CDS:1, partial [Gigaspora rosea]